MAENQYQNASEFQLKKCVISKGDGSQPTSLLSGDMIIAFSFHESVFHPFVGASLMLSDSNGLINTFPIQGGEIVEIEVIFKSRIYGNSKWKNNFWVFIKHIFFNLVYLVQLRLTKVKK